VSLRTSGLDVISPPIFGAPPVTTLNTPAGTPARIGELGQRERRERRLRGRLAHHVQPAASAGPTLRVIIADGKFHGVIAAHHADRLLQHEEALVGRDGGNHVAVDALGFLGEPLDERGAVGDLAARFGERLALLGGHDVARSSWLASIRSLQRRRMAPRSLAVRAAQAGIAARAASIARRDPGRIICVGMNYLEHIHEMGRKRPAYPGVFIRFNDSMVGHGQPVCRPQISTQYDYEGELAVVIGRPARYLEAAQALDYVAGYTCLLDGSVRDWQNHTTQFIPGKNFPASGSCGPWLVTTDEVPDPAKLKLSTRVNGETVQSAPLSDLCFDIPQIVAYCSGFCQLNPGDIIATGTPSGVGFARKPPRWLKAGDRVEVEIDGIGVLANTVVDEACAERR
jgi:2-keto-4-pentenoate hydratase/2-oxohepta-3-ene-1,7-dioic acid hydratase in catechol pathway